MRTELLGIRSKNVSKVLSTTHNARLVVGLGLAATLLLACQPIQPVDMSAGTPAATVEATVAPAEEATAEATEEATAEATEEATAEATEEVSSEADAIVALAVEALAGELQVNADTITVVGAEAVEWPNACLGVQNPEVMCAQVVTPGFRILLSVDGVEYAYHTNADGSEVLLAYSADPTLLARVVEVAASDLQVSADLVEIVAVEAVEWPDSCLGVTDEGVMCAQVVTPGYRVVLNADGTQHAYHTDAEGNTILLAAPEE